MYIKDKLNTINNQIVETAQRCGRNPNDITLVAVSKKKSVDTIIEAIESGVKIFGENYIQEAVDKIAVINKKIYEQNGEQNKNNVSVNKPVLWHFIGHLQSNKAKIAVKYFDLIHTVDSFKLAQEINRQAEKIGKIQNILIQINISQEDTKSGIEEEEGIELALNIVGLKSISLRGVMGMPPFFDEPERARPYFKKLAHIRNAIINATNHSDYSINDNFAAKQENRTNTFMNHISMGMSGDFKIAIEEGSTMVRIGTSIFGDRI